MGEQQEPANRKNTGRNPDGTFMPGVSGNPNGRPKNTLKEYLKQKLNNMSDEQKEVWLKEHKINGDLQWQMAEGRPQQDVTTDGEPLTPILVKFIDGKPDDNTDTPGI